MDVAGKLIVITGAGRGLGLAMAQHFDKAGASLALVDVDKASVTTLAASLQHARGYETDISDESAVVTLFETIVKDFGRLDGLVNNAGILRDGLLIREKDGNIDRLPLQHWQQVINVNLTGVFLCGREAAAQMVSLKTPGVIVNISSISRAGNFGQTNYSAAKAGVAAMTTTWAKELGRYNIRCAAVAPGFIATDMTAQMPEAAIAQATAAVPLKRMGTPEDVAKSVNFIFENDYFTGRIIETDGGLRI